MSHDLLVQMAYCGAKMAGLDLVHTELEFLKSQFITRPRFLWTEQGN